eukprot:Gb_38004 [translate_table: standard]
MHRMNAHGALDKLGYASTMGLSKVARCVSPSLLNGQKRLDWWATAIGRRHWDTLAYDRELQSLKCWKIHSKVYWARREPVLCLSAAPSRRDEDNQQNVGHGNILEGKSNVETIGNDMFICIAKDNPVQTEGGKNFETLINFDFSAVPILHSSKSSNWGCIEGLTTTSFSSKSFSKEMYGSQNTMATAESRQITGDHCFCKKAPGNLDTLSSSFIIDSSNESLPSMDQGRDEILLLGCHSCSSKSVSQDFPKNANAHSKSMKMERFSHPGSRDSSSGGCVLNPGDLLASKVRKGHWFPYMDQFKSADATLSSLEILQALDPYILETRKQRIREVVRNRSYSVCLVVEGLTDFGNISAIFRSADALGFQSVHVISNDSTKRYKQNRNVSMGAEKWLDIEQWETPRECFEVLRSRGYRIAVTHIGIDTVSVHDMDWTLPTAIVLGNEHKGISEEALQLSDMKCSIPMAGMVDSFNVSVAAGIVMHHAVHHRISHMGSHGDLRSEECQILSAEFYLRHNKNAVSILNRIVENENLGRSVLDLCM